MPRLKRSANFGNRVGAGLRRLDGMLGIDHSTHGEWFWAVPGLVLIATIGGFLLIGQVTAAPLVVSVPNGVVIALVMAGLAVACMTPAADSDAGRGDPPDGHDDSPVIGTPGGPWVLVAHLPAAPREESENADTWAGYFVHEPAGDLGQS